MKDYERMTDEELVEEWNVEDTENPDADLCFELCKRAGTSDQFINYMQMDEIDEAMNLSDEAASFLYYRN